MTEEGKVVPETTNKKSTPDFIELEILRLQIAFQEKKMLHDQQLLQTGLKNGAQAVWGAFITFGVLFLFNFVANIWGIAYITSLEVLWFAILMCVTLIAYFSFIFGYIIYLSADFKGKKLDISSRKA